ncbi:hypothetical protein [Nocardia vaccinii]|uniref:hypothetical protein n=1 Tax=Nocardia vaccinii TaxID=1822 RepID=UPI00082D226A|nr:hypothetical protein [Nocardia vaccinii]
MTYPDAPAFDLPRDDLMRGAAAIRTVAAAIRTVRERRGRAAFSDPEHAARLRAVAARNALLSFDSATIREWNSADRDNRVRGAAHPHTGMTVRVTELSRGRYGVQAGWDENHVETVVGDQHLARQLAEWLMADPTVDRLDELRNALDPRVRRPSADRAASAQAWGRRHDPLWLTHWRTPEDLVRAWRQATGRDPAFNADLAAARANAAAADPDWYRGWWLRHSDAPTPGARHLAEFEIIRRHGRTVNRADPSSTAAEDADRHRPPDDSSVPPQGSADDRTSPDEQAAPTTGPAGFEQARAWARATDPTWYDLWSAHYSWADTHDGLRALEDELLSRWRRRDTVSPPADNASNDPGRTPMTPVQAAILTDAGRQPDPGLTWVEASLLIDEIRGTPRGEKAGEWLREHGLSDEAADRAIADAVAKLYPNNPTQPTSPTPTQTPSSGEDIAEWFRTHDPDYFRQWSAELATARDQFRSQRQLAKLWAQLTGHDLTFSADLAAARYQAANNDPDALRRWREDRDAATTPTARHEFDRQLIQHWHPAHSFRADNFFHTEPTPTLAQLLRGRVPDRVLDHPRWSVAEEAFAGLVERGAQADSLADAVAAVDFDRGGIRAPSGYAAWLMRDTAKATVPDPGSDADRRRLVAEWLADADPTNPINRSLAAQLVGEFDAAFDADIARAFPGILDGDAHHHSHYDDHPDTTLLNATRRVFVADTEGTVQPAFRTADHILAVDARGRTNMLTAVDRTFIADNPTQIAYRSPEPDEPQNATPPAEPTDVNDDTLSRAEAPLTPPIDETVATPKPTLRQPRPAGMTSTRKLKPSQRRRTP